MHRDLGMLLMLVSTVSLLFLFFRMIKIEEKGHHWTDNLYEKVPRVVLGAVSILSGWGVGYYAASLPHTTRAQAVVNYGGAFAFAVIIPLLALSLLVVHFLRGEEPKKKAVS